MVASYSKNLFTAREFANALMVALLLFMATGCAGAPAKNHKTVAKVSEAPIRAPEHVVPSTPSVENRLRMQVRTWRHTPHKMGGTDRRGVDCSGFVQRLYRDVFQRSIPRTTATQVKSGRPVERSRLQPGDLVFFKPPEKIRHVGIYLGRGEFAHASTSQGVIISSLSEDYWRRSYWTARRYRKHPAEPFAAAR